MRRFIIKLLVFLMIFSAASFAVFSGQEKEEKTFHVHVFEIEALSLGDEVSICPDCHTGYMTVVEIVQPTCVNEGMYILMCYECSNSSGPRYLSALGHDFSIVVYQEKPTCTASGYTTYQCSRCGTQTNYTNEALGHNYKSEVTKEATCTEDGVRTYTCSRCSSSYTRAIEMLGHDFVHEELDPTCTEDGYKKDVCSRCHEENMEVLPALGHDIQKYVTVKQPTCTEDGAVEGTCERCGLKVSDVLLRMGHKYPAEWTVEKKPTYFAEGLQYKLCKVCGHRIEQILPKLSPEKIISVTGALALALGGGLFFFFKKFGRMPKKALKNKGKWKPDFEDKSVLCASSDESLLKTLKDRKFLAVSTCEFAEIEEQALENEPDIVIADVNDDDSFDKLVSLKDEVLAKQAIGLVIGHEYLKENREKLDSFVKEKTFVNYVDHSADMTEILSKLILPVLKPDLKSDTQLGNIGSIADALGIPGVSAVIDAYVNGRDIKATIEEGEWNVSSIATIIGDIASLFGFEEVADVAGLVDDVESVKSALDKEAGANEKRSGVEGAKDFVEVVSDLVDRE